jgi:hypothetical protein
MQLIAELFMRQAKILERQLEHVRLAVKALANLPSSQLIQ